MRMSMSRLSDGSPNDRTEELEETETNPLADWLQHHVQVGNLRFVETKNGIDIYQKLREIHQ